ncbi:MAG: hypothetical protein WCT26_01475 [Candidatus Buchananbacteria bacterium]
MGIGFGFFLPFWLQIAIIAFSIYCLVRFMMNPDGPEGESQNWFMHYYGTIWGIPFSIGLIAADLIQLLSIVKISVS